MGCGGDDNYKNLSILYTLIFIFHLNLGAIQI